VTVRWAFPSIGSFLTLWRSHSRRPRRAGQGQRRGTGTRDAAAGCSGPTTVFSHSSSAFLTSDLVHAFKRARVGTSNEEKQEKMSWNKLFFTVLTTVVGNIAKKGLDLAPEFLTKLRAWWTGKTIAVIGPTAAGKNSLFNRLRKLPIPEKHVQTRGAEKVANFEISWPMPDNTHVKFRCRKSINIGGEIDERERYWLQACQNADVLFYLLDSSKLASSQKTTIARYQDDMRWLVANFRELNPSIAVHILLNKVDITLGSWPHDASATKLLTTQVALIEGHAKEMLGDYFGRVTGITPISMENDFLFGKYFTQALGAVANRRQS